MTVRACSARSHHLWFSISPGRTLYGKVEIMSIDSDCDNDHNYDLPCLPLAVVVVVVIVIDILTNTEGDRRSPLQACAII